MKTLVKQYILLGHIILTEEKSMFDEIKDLYTIVVDDEYILTVNEFTLIGDIIDAS